MEKVIYLTIDDGPSEDFKEKVDFLKSKRIPAIWFCRGDFIEQRPEEIVHAIRAGFVIGNHSYDHPYFSEISASEAEEQIKKTHEIIEETYKKAGIKRPAHIFRFCYGDKGQKNKDIIQKYLKELGYKQPKFDNISYGRRGWCSLFSGHSKDVDVHWTYEIYEYRLKTLQEVFDRMDEKTSKSGGSLCSSDSNEIVLLHDHPETSEWFIPIVEKLMEKGARFELPELKS